MTQWAGRASRPRIMAAGVLLNWRYWQKPNRRHITVVLPAVGVQITDKDNLRDEIDDISDKVDYYDEVVDNPLGANSAQSARRAESLSGRRARPADELNISTENRPRQCRRQAGGKYSRQTLSVAFIAKGYAHGRVSSSIDQNDIQYLRDIQHDERVALREAGRAALLGPDEITAFKPTASGAG